MKNVRRLCYRVLSVVIAFVMSFTVNVPASSEFAVVVNGERLSFDVPPRVVNNRVLVPVRAIFEKLGAEISWNAETKTVSASHGGKSLSLVVGSGTAMVDGEEVALDCPAINVDGRVLVPVRFVSSALGADVDFDEESKTVYVQTSSKENTPYTVVEVTASGDDGNAPVNVIDGDFNTRWSCQEYGAWLTLDLGKVLPVGYMGVAFYLGDERISYFDVEYSTDNVTYTTLSSQNSSPTLNMIGVDFNGIEARYIKFVGYGNSMNSWNSVTEIKLYPPTPGGEMILTGGTVISDEARENDVSMLGDDIKNAFVELKKLCGRDVLDFMASLYDKESGGFYYSVSARDNEGFLPDVESTMEVIDFLKTTGCYTPAMGRFQDLFPAEISQKFITFAQEMQDADDGYFYHKQWGKGITDSRRGRDLGWATSLISTFGGKCLYPTANERIAATMKNSGKNVQSGSQSSAVPEYLTSEESLLNWLEALPWNTNAYSAANSINAAVSRIKAAGYIDFVVEYLTSIQNSETGLWGEGLTYNAVNACMKIGTAYVASSYEFPNAQNALESIIKVVLESETPGAVIDVYNPWCALYSMRTTLSKNGELPPWFDETLRSNAAKMILKSRDLLAKFKKSDGGFSYTPNKSSSTSQGAPVSLGLAEGDVNATIIAVQGIMEYAYNALGVKMDAPYGEDDMLYFVDKISGAAPVVKKEVKTEVFYDFTNGIYGRVPTIDSFTADVVNGRVTYSRDPYMSKNTVVCFDTKKGNNESVVFNVSANDSIGSVELEFDILLSDFGKGYSMEMNMGPIGGYDMIFYSADGKTFSIGDRCYFTGPSDRTELFGKFEFETWYNVKIVYTFGNADTMKTTVYIDDELFRETNKFYASNESGGGEPAKMLSLIVFTSFMNAEGRMYLDNFRFAPHKYEK